MSDQKPFHEKQMRNKEEKLNGKVQEDIFDKVMRLAMFQSLRPLYNRYKEAILYLFFGGCSFVICVGSYAVFSEVLSIGVLAANVYAWILTIIFSYITSKVWVFKKNSVGLWSSLKEIMEFLFGRILTLFIEEVILYLLVTKASFNNLIVKILTAIVVILLNYIFSKFIVFYGTDEKSKS